MNVRHCFWQELYADAEMIVTTALTHGDMHVVVLTLLEINPLGELNPEIAGGLVSQLWVVVPEGSVATPVEKEFVCRAGRIHRIGVLVEPKRAVVIAAHQEAVSAGHRNAEVSLERFN
jgi:hypothetical protein